MKADGKLTWARMSSGSMFPLVPEGAILFFSSPHELRVGDLVVFQRSPGEYVCHRLVRIQDGRYLTWGDWCRHPDPEREVSQVEARCVALVRKGKFVSMDWLSLTLLSSLVARILPALKSLASMRRSPRITSRSACRCSNGCGPAAGE